MEGNTMPKWQYFNSKIGSVEEVEPEEWAWEVVYNDGFVLKQFDDAGTFHRFNEIDRTKIHLFRMINMMVPEGQIPKPPITIIWRSNMKPVEFKKRITIKKHFMGERVIGVEKIKVYCFGYEENINGRNATCIMAIAPSDEFGYELIVTDDLDKVEVD